jgi:hypothetical protein
MKVMMIPLMALAASLSFFTANKAQASGGYTFECGFSWSVPNNPSYSGKGVSFELISPDKNDEPEEFERVAGDLKATATLSGKEVISVAIENLKTGEVIKGNEGVSSYNKKTGERKAFGCGLKLEHDHQD